MFPERHNFFVRTGVVISLLFVALFFWNIATSLSFYPMSRAITSTDTLAPELRLKYHGLEMQTLMALAELAGKSLSEGVRPDRFEDFMKASPLVTDDMRERINFSMMATDGKTVRVVYNGDKGVVVLAFEKKSGPDTVERGLSPARGAIDLGDIAVTIEKLPEDLSKTTLPDDKDITLSAQGNAMKHDSGKKVVEKQPSGWFARLMGRKETKVVRVDDDMGINDIVRASFKFQQQKHVLIDPKGGSFYGDASSEMPKILDALRDLPGGKKIADSIESNGYKIYVYMSTEGGFEFDHEYFEGREKEDLMCGVDTHFGIRTGSIHISSSAYKYLSYGGTKPYLLAARIAHEVTELDLWRAKAAQLVKEGKIEGLGTVTAEESAEWANGIRKWIIDNCNPAGTGAAQVLDREFHKRGVELEMAMRARALLNIPKELIVSPKYLSQKDKLFYAPLIEMAEECLKWGKNNNYSFSVFEPLKHQGFMDGRLNPRHSGQIASIAAADELRKEIKRIYEKYFDKDKEGENKLPDFLRLGLLASAEASVNGDAPVFLNFLLARLYLWQAQNEDGDLTGFRDRIAKLDVVDRFAKAEIEKWFSQVELQIKEYPEDQRTAILNVLAEIKVMIAKKSDLRGLDAYAKRSIPEQDKSDVIGSAQGGSPYEPREIISYEAGKDLKETVDSLSKSLDKSGAWDGVAAQQALPVDGKGVVIFADDVMDSSAVFDLAKLAGLIGKEGKFLNKVVLYAKDDRKAAIIEDVIKENNPEADVVIITGSELKDYYGNKIYKMSAVESVLRYALNSKTGVFTRPDQVLGVVRGPLTKDEDEDQIKDELRRSSLKVPVVAFEDGLPGNVYSLVQAVVKLAEMRAADIGERTLFSMLPPITRITEALQKEYEKYMYLLRKLEAAA